MRADQEKWYSNVELGSGRVGLYLIWVDLRQSQPTATTSSEQTALTQAYGWVRVWCTWLDCGGEGVWARWFAKRDAQRIATLG